MQIEITSLRGAKIIIEAGYPEIGVTLDVKGETHTIGGKITHNSVLGDHIVLNRFATKAQPRTGLDIKIQISAEDRKTIERDIIAPELARIQAEVDADNATRKAWLQTPAGKSWLLTKRMERGSSDL